MKTYKKSRASYPAGILAIYENRKAIDRYTVVFAPEIVDGMAWFTTLHMSADCGGGYGYCQHGQYSFRPTKAQGDKVIDYDALPERCRVMVEWDLQYDSSELVGAAR